ncbi:thioredoxin-like protein Clot [Dendrobium catenatum]|uniref:Thioredoxin-like protein Clot n=1 Tax=Dendrobium catenatum TaxID=906689 RepID=A0A2I0W0G0_9ASPA|nr:thioredoxin-like protein Clot [Dendrobium catenatum]PKU69139.1 Thioredoxin-like protein Clot [Dendrobium catenatum]
MPLTTVVEAKASDFELVFEKFKEDNSVIKLLLFLADKDPSTELSWCPDCNVAEPVIYEKLSASASDVAILKAFVGDRPTWRNPNHPWRVDPRFKLRGVPTLIRWENDTITGRLEDYEAHVGSKIDALLAGT